MSLEVGKQASIEFKVKESDLASNLGISSDDNFPEVFATARLVALMEAAAAKAMKSLLEGDKLSVGVEVKIKHLAPTLLDDSATAIATFKGMEGKLYKFYVETKDSGGVIGTCTHTRAIVSKERLMQGAQKRVK